MAIKKKAIYTGLLLFTLWPLVQMQLALRFGVSPWKLAGWGMYAAPRFDKVNLRLLARKRGHSEFEIVQEIPQELHLVTWRFLDAYRWLHQLGRPDRLAQELFSALPDVEQLRFIVQQPAVDRTSATIVLTEAEYLYTR